jgi:type IV pilus assembly protein PilQ
VIARIRIVLVVSTAVALAAMASLVGVGAAESPTLRKIESRLDDRAAVIAIEASDPVPYVASQPDPHTFVIELRDVVADGFRDAFKADPRHPVAKVEVEPSRAVDGVAVARVRMELTTPQRPRVRSARNVIYIEADRLDRVSTPATLSGPSSAIRDLRVGTRGAATEITLRATGRLVTAAVEQSENGRQVFLDLSNATSALPTVTAVGQGPVERVRIGLNPTSPLLTRVTLDLSRPSPYRLEPSADGLDLTVVFEDTAAAPVLQPAAQALLARAATVAPAAARSQALAALAVQDLPPAPAQAPVPAAPAPAPQQAPPRYVGVPISLDFQGADLRAVLRTFGEISGLNIVIDPSIQGTVDVALRDVPWDQALDIILRANRLGYVVDGTIVRIAPLTALADEEAQRRKLEEERALAGELRVLTRSLSYARAETMAPLLERIALSQRGSIQVDQRTNTLIITDLSDRLTRASDLIATLDRPEPQVEIEARIIQTSRDFARNLGVQWGVSGRAIPGLGNTLPLTFPNSAEVTAGVDLSTQASSTLGLALGSINGALNLDVALSALERTGQGRVLSTPRVSTQNNIEAEITQGVQIPIQTIANNTVTVSFKDAALSLRVVPQITAANTVIMRITLENAVPNFGRQVNGIPPIDTQRAITQVLVADGETTVIGGIFVNTEQTTQDRTPGLYQIPLLGWLFKRETVTDESRELLIFITPRISRL